MTPLFIPFAVLSVAAFTGAAVTLFRFFSGAFKERTDWPFQPAYLLGMGFFLLANWFILIPVYLSATALHPYQCVMAAFVTALQEFTVDIGGADVLEMTHGFIPLSVYLSVFMVISPILTVGALLSLLKDFFANIRLCFWKRDGNADIYVFSKLTPESIALAESIRADDDSAPRESRRARLRLVFCDVHASDEETLAELIERANEIDALPLKKDITLLKLFCDVTPRTDSGERRCKRHFFAIGADETENSSLTLTISSQWQRYIRGRKNADERRIPDTRFYVFSTTAESEFLFEKTVRENIASVKTVPVSARGLILRVNEQRALVYNRLYLYGDRMFLSDKRGENGAPVSKNHISRQEQINAVVIGAGGYGSEMIRALPWYCHMNRSSVHIDVYDRDPASEARLRYRAPALFDEDKNGAGSALRRSYHIEFHSEIDIFSVDFDNSSQSIGHPDYVLVALGADHDNITAALHVRMLCERMGVHPVIEAIVSDSDRAAALSDLGIMTKNKQTKSMEMTYRYDIDFIGDIRSRYSYGNIVMPSLNEKAYACHTRWASSDEEREQFYISEYCYRSSLAAAIRQSARLQMGFTPESVVKGDGAGDELTADECEHIGWWEWMLAEGFRYNAVRNDLARYHNDMIPFLELPEVEKEKDRRMLQ